jgi:hypothetical protein
MRERTIKPPVFFLSQRRNDEIFFPISTLQAATECNGCWKKTQSKVKKRESERDGYFETIKMKSGGSDRGLSTHISIMDESCWRGR